MIFCDVIRYSISGFPWGVLQLGRFLSISFNFPRLLLILTVCLIVIGPGAQRLCAQGTAFTFQGRLTDGRIPATGAYDFQFTLRDSATDGNQIGSPVVIAPLAVTRGLFTAVLDFGAGAFDGSRRWIEVSARTNGSSSAYTVLQPRTMLTATPYAIFKPSGGGLDAITNQIAALNSQIATLNAQIEALNAQVTNLSSQSVGMTADLTGLGTQLANLNGQFVGLGTYATNLGS
jgi:hypothetical protein